MFGLIKEGIVTARVAQPTKSLYQGKRYTNSASTDIRRTFEAHKRLIRMKQATGATQGIAA